MHSNSTSPDDIHQVSLTSTSNAEDNLGSPFKKSRLADWEEDSEDIRKSEVDEVKAYIESANTRDMQDLNMLQWWENYSSTFPLLAKLARKILVIPATSASSERTFSSAGMVVDDKRNNIKAENVDSILVI